MIGYGVCVGSWEKFNAYVVPHVGEAPLLGLSGQTSITTAYNMILDSFAGQGLDALVLQHADLEITDDQLESKIMDALSMPDVEMVGCAGGRKMHNYAWWEGETVGHQQINTGMIDFGRRTGYADVIEGSFMVLSPWVIENLRFDPRYDGFHGYDDIGMVINKHGKKVWVADIDTHHHTVLGFHDDAHARAWHETNKIFCEKWGL